VPMRSILCLCAIALILPSFADSKVLTTGNALDVRLESALPVLPSASGPMVRGSLQVSPHPIKPVCDRIVFYVDDTIKLAGNAPGSKLILDTAKLPDGPHSLRIEAERGGKLFISTGSIAFQVANAEGAAVLDEQVQFADQPSPAFGKLFKAVLTHEAVWFNGEEGDLERHAFGADDQVYITLTDLLRHIGGQIIWGPTAQYIEVHRNDVTLQVTPDSNIVLVNANEVELSAPVVVRENRTYVPLKPFCDLFGVYSEWSALENRVYVYAPQPGFGVALRDYPWINPVTGVPAGLTTGVLTFRNETTLPIHVRLSGNGFQADWQIRGDTTIGPCFIAAGTYKITLWATHGEDYEDYITVAAGTHDVYYVTLNSIALQTR